MAARSRIRRRLGDVVKVPLSDTKFSFGRVLLEPLMAFYSVECSEMPSLEKITSAPVSFIVFVMNYAVTKGIWPVIANVPLEKELLVEPLFYKRDLISGRLTIYRDSTQEEFSATGEECLKLEAAAVWDPNHVVDRLRDQFAGRPNDWFESLRP